MSLSADVLIEQVTLHDITEIILKGEEIIRDIQLLTFACE
jgi:hypothetical protein